MNYFIHLLITIVKKSHINQYHNNNNNSKILNILKILNLTLKIKFNFHLKMIKI